MKEYFKVASVSESEVNKFLDRGWEIIETVKSKEEFGEYVKYHIGFPLKSAFEMAREILNAYDKHDFRLQMLESEAAAIGEDLSDYEPFPGQRTNNSLVELLEKSDFILSGVVNPTYYKNRKEIDLHEDMF